MPTSMAGARTCAPLDPMKVQAAEPGVDSTLLSLTRTMGAAQEQLQSLKTLICDPTAKDVLHAMPEPWRRRQVQMHVTVKGIFNLDTIAQTFGVQLSVIMLWECPASEWISEAPPPTPEEDDGDWVPQWTPKYRIKQQMEEKNVSTLYTLRTINGISYVLMEADHLVTIYEELELNSFPTDLQDLTIELESRVPADRLIWTPFKDGTPPARVFGGKCYLNDFALVAECPFTYNMCCARTEERTVSTMMVQLKVARKSSYYLLNVNLIMMLLCLFSLCAWATHPADIQGRQGIDLTLILTAVAFKLVLIGMLPPVSYVTTLDVYVLMSFLFLTSVTVTHTVLPLYFIAPEDHSPLTEPPQYFDGELDFITCDRMSFWVFIGLLVIGNVCYITYFLSRQAREYAAFVRRAREDQRRFDESCDEIITNTDVSLASPSKPQTAAVLQEIYV